MKNGTALIRIAAAWLLLFMLGIAAAMITIGVVNSREFGPEKTVQHYLQALREGDGSRALGLLQAKVPSANAAALDGPALAQTQAALGDVRVADAVDAAGNQKRVTVSYTVDGEELSTDFLLVSGPRQWLFFDTWTMVPSTLPTVSASVVNANEASINGVPANMPAGRNSFAVFYPGSYELEFRSALFAAPPVTRVVTGADQAVPAVALASGPTSDLLAQVDGVIRKYLDDCAQQAVLMPTGCPMTAISNNRVASPITWTIVGYPAITITPFNGQWVLAPLTVKTQLAFEEQDLFTGVLQNVKQNSEFEFTAKLQISGTDVSVTPVINY
ncbi:hypothetical protein ACFUCV_14335 [Specibacter sp. NPDC057265]|uniref:hypothetical protein n=1 Tax=Specibacter sp. NPDC057265 TaxID=3346075 RepID=UPI00363BAC9F